jgi:hypothetical protein
MKNTIIIFLIVSVTTFSCKKETTPDTIINPPLPIDTTISTIRYTGNFQNGPWGTTSGTAIIIETNGKFQLRLEGFRVSSGPDLKVYLSKELQPLNFLRLGNLKALSGNQAYDIPGSPNLMDYPYALIHCEKFNHLFGSAQLMMQ